MPHFEIYPKMLLRTPSLPYIAYPKHSDFQEHLDNPQIQQAIFLASRSFYDLLSSKKFCIADLPQKCQHTFRKYINRMTHRTTPFGTFSAFALVDTNADKTGLRVNKIDHILHIDPDQSEIEFLYANYQELNPQTVPLKTNGSLYTTSSDLRYVFIERGNGGTHKFSVKKVTKDAALINLLQFCKKAKPLSEIMEHLSERFGMTDQEIHSLLQSLRVAQLLLPEIEMNLTGENAFHRIMRLSDKTIPQIFKADNVIYKNIRQFSQQSYEHPERPMTYYANLRCDIAGGLSTDVKRNLGDALYALRKLSVAEDPAPLVAFRSAFARRYDRQVVSLMEALDPETGITYSNLSRSENNGHLLEDIDLNPVNSSNSNIDWSKIHQLLLSFWPGETRGCILLTDELLAAIPDHTGRLPPSLSLLFRVYGKKLQIEQGGGTSATAILGRFAALDPVVYDHSQCIARDETEDNPAVIFTEVVHASGGHVDNINRRAGIREYEIPVLTSSLLSEDKQIPLSDLYLQLELNELQLWSKRLNKQVIPRMSSAFNHQRSELPLFRLLTDLQYQGLQHTWQLDLTRLFPNLPWYPRVEYKNIILAPATWKIRREALPVNFKATAVLQRKQFRDFSQLVKIPCVFNLSRGDQYIVFDQEVDADLDLFLAEIRTAEEITLREVFEEGLREGTLINTRGETHANQFVAAIRCAKPTYQPQSPPLWSVAGQPGRRLAPGSNWLYYKLYCPDYNSNEILLSINRALQRLGSAKNDLQWFFVRYMDPEPHLRLRIQANQDRLPEITRSIYRLSAPMIKKQLIIRLETATYERELERYAAIGISTAEKLFCQNSALILTFLSLNKKRLYPEFYPALIITWHIISITLPDSRIQIEFITNVQQMLFHDFGGSASLKRSLDEKKRALRDEVTKLLDGTIKMPGHWNSALKTHVNQWQALKPIKPWHRDQQLLGDLLHMQINRIFSAHMREQEMVTYTLLLQYAITKQKKG